MRSSVSVTPAVDGRTPSPASSGRNRGSKAKAKRSSAGVTRRCSHARCRRGAPRRSLAEREVEDVAVVLDDLVAGGDRHVAPALGQQQEHSIVELGALEPERRIELLTYAL